MIKKIEEQASKLDHKSLMIWAVDCVCRVLIYFEGKYPNDDRPMKKYQDQILRRKNVNGSIIIYWNYKFLSIEKYNDHKKDILV